MYYDSATNSFVFSLAVMQGPDMKEYSKRLFVKLQGASASYRNFNIVSFRLSFLALTIIFRLQEPHVLYLMVA